MCVYMYIYTYMYDIYIYIYIYIYICMLRSCVRVARYARYVGR